MKYIHYIFSKVFSILPVIFGVTIVSFFLIHLIPGDPVRIMLHGRATDEVVKQIYQELGWDKPILSQYFDFLFNSIRGDFGKSYGLNFKNGPFETLHSRCIVVLDEQGNVLHTEQVQEVADEPNYEAALNALKK